VLTFASSIVNELESGEAVAVESSRGVDAPLRAAAIVVETLVAAAFLAGLVLPVRTIWLLVAYFAQRNADARRCTGGQTAVKLCVRVALWRRRC